MKARELIEILQTLSPDADVMFDGSRGIGTVIEIFHAWQDTYVFFGNESPCVILSDRKRSERDEALAEREERQP